MPKCENKKWHWPKVTIMSLSTNVMSNFFFQLQQMYPRVTDIELNFSRMPSPQWSSISISEKSRMTKKRRHIIGCNWRQRQLQPMDCVNRKCRWEEKIRHSIRWSKVTYYFRPTECLIFFFESQVVHTLLRYSVFLLMQNVLRQLRNVFFLWATGIIYIFPKYSNHPPPTPALSPSPPPPIIKILKSSKLFYYYF